MPKTRNEEKIKRYRREIQRIEEREQRKRQRIIYSSTDSSDENSDNEQPIEVYSEPEHNCDGVSNTEDSNKTGCDQDQVPVSQLNPNILTALGESTEEAPKFGPKIHEHLSRLWLPILRKGMKKETKENIMKEYLIPENCPLLQAPKLNPEVSAAVTEGTRTRDKRVESVQQQLGLGITALNKGLELLLDEGIDRIQAIKYLSDSCRLLCDLHYVETEARKKFVTPALDKSFLNVVQDVDREELLFGNKLSEKIKATKVIEKHGLQIKKPPINPKPASFISKPSTSRSRAQINWGGPPRFPLNRRARRAEEDGSFRAKSSGGHFSVEDVNPEQTVCSESSALEAHVGRIRFFIIAD